MRLESKRRTLLVLLLVLFAGTAFADGGQIFLSTNGRFVLPGVESKEIFKQCSRSVPAQMDGFWEPKPADLDLMERRLLAFLAGQRKKPPAQSYNRQYVGFRRDGKLYIYGNFYPSTPASELKKQDTLPVLVCDGGASFWGIVYRVDTGQFDALTFNGHV